MAPRGIEMGLVMVLVAMLWARATAQSGCTTVLIGMAPCLNYVSGNSSTPSSSCCSQLASVVKSQPQCLCTALNGGAALGITINQTLALALPSACNVQTPPVSRCNAADGPATSPVASAVGSPEGSPGDSSGSPTAATSPVASAVGSPEGSPGDSSDSPTAATSPVASAVGSPEGSPGDSSNETPDSPTAATSPVASAVGSPEGSPGDSSNSTPDSPTSSSVAGASGSKTVPSTDGVSSDGSTMKMPFQLAGFLLFMASYASAFSSF